MFARYLTTDYKTGMLHANSDSLCHCYQRKIPCAIPWSSVVSSGLCWCHGYITAEVGARPVLREHWGSEEHIHRQSRRGNAICYRAASNLWKLNMWGALSTKTWAWALSQVTVWKGKRGGSGGRGWGCWNRAEWWAWKHGWMWNWSKRWDREFDNHGRGKR